MTDMFFNLKNELLKYEMKISWYVIGNTIGSMMLQRLLTRINFSLSTTEQ